MLVDFFKVQNCYLVYGYTDLRKGIDGLDMRLAYRGGRTYSSVRKPSLFVLGACSENFLGNE